jgi:hypothetical protein
MSSMAAISSPSRIASSSRETRSPAATRAAAQARSASAGVLAASKAPAADAAAASDDTVSSRKNVDNDAWPACTLPNAGDGAVCGAGSVAAEGPPNVGWPVGEEAIVYSAGKVFRQARCSSTLDIFKHP